MLHQRCTGTGAGRAWLSHRSPLRPTTQSRRLVAPCVAGSSPFKIQLRHPVKLSDADERPLLIFLPGTDGTGQAIMPQLPRLMQSGYDVRTLYIPPDDRSGWDQLQAQTLYLISKTLGARRSSPHNVQVTIVAESFGGCLALRLAAAAPQLVKALVLVNPATSYNQSLSGLSSFVAATNLLGLFPQNLYNTAQAILLPFLVDIDRVGEEGARALRSMIFMDKPPDYETPATLQVYSYDDEEQDFESLTLAAERRHLQLSSAATFTTAGQQTARAGYLDTEINPVAPSSPRLGSAGRSRGRVIDTAAAAGVFRIAAGGAGIGGGSVFAPAAAANFRANLMRNGNLRDRVLKDIQVPCLLVSSAKDRMLPSLAEGARLARLLPNSRRVILPDSGHAALLERGMDLAAVMRGSGIMPTALGPTASAAAARAGAAAAGRQSAGGGVAVPTAGAAAQTPVIIGVVKDEQAVPGVGDGDDVVTPRPATVFPSVTPTAAAAAAGNGKPAATAARTPVGTAAALDDNQASVSAGEAARSAAALAAVAAASAGGVANIVADDDSSSRAATAAAAAAPSNGSGSAGNGQSSGENIRDSSQQDGLNRELAAVSNGGSNGTNGADKQQQQRTSSGDKDLAWDQWSQYLAPWRDLVSPVLLGQEHLPGLVSSDRPLLFVGNHQKMGLYDMPLLAYELYMRGFKVKGLAHPGHWRGPLGPFFEQFGAVKAGPMTAFKLLKAGEQVLLFPGGAREVNKKVGQEYQLFWRESADFVRLAARCDAIIVPFAAVGADDAYDVMLEADELLQTPVLGDLVKGALARVDPSLDPAEAALPLTRIPGLGLPTLVPVPNLQRLYFKVCEPIDTRELGLSVRGDAQGWQQLYDSIKQTVTSGMQELLEVRAADDQRYVGARISKTVQSWLPAFNITQVDGQSNSSSTVQPDNSSTLSK